MRSFFVLRFHDLKEILDAVWDNPDKLYVVVMLLLVAFVFWVVIFKNRGKKNG